MAKDKSKKAATTDGFAKPSEAPNTGGDSWNFEDKSGVNTGKLFLITPLREDEHVDKFDKNKGMKQHIVANVVELNEKKPEKSVEHEEVWIFGGYVRGSLRGYMGEQKVLARLERDIGDKKFKSSNEPWYLEDADEDDVAVARAYIESVVNGAVADLGGKAEKTGKKSKK